MTTTTFGFDAVQDRIWMRVHEQGQTVWLTRRMVGGFLGPVIQNFERATPGEQGGAPAAARATIEHDLSLNEMAPGQVAPQIRVGRVLPGQDSDLQQYLCSRLTTRSGQQAVTMTFDTPAGPLVLKLSRKGMHMWLRGLTMVLRHAQWGLPHTLPSWLIAGLMPPVIRALVQQPLPDNLDPDQDAS